MSRWLEKNTTVQALLIVSTVFILVTLAYGVVESAVSGRVSFEIFLILLLVAPSICLPAMAFRSHARSKQRSREIIRTKSLQLNLVLDNMAQGLCMFDGDKRLIVCNQRYAEMYGLSPEIIVPGTTFREILQYRISNGVFSGQDHEAYIQERLAAVSERERSSKIQQLSDGRYIAICHTPMPGGGWLATHEDNSERKRSETALMESEARFRAIFDNAPFCVNLKDTEGRYLFVNNRYEEWWGIATDEAIGKKNEDFNHAPDRAQNAGAIENAVLESGKPCEREVYTCHPVTGKACHRLISKFPVNAPDGTMMAIGTISVDITERKRAEKALMESEAQLRAIFDNAPFCVNLKDLDGKYIYANKQYAEWWGCPVEEAIGKTAREFHECSDRVKECSALEKLVIETGETKEREIGIDRDNNGHIYHRLFIKFPVKSPDGDIMALGTFAVDITERKRAEEELIGHRDHLQDLVHAATHDLKQQALELETALAREKEVNELQRQFISMASHEFRTPLAIIDSTAQRLRKSSEKTTPEDILKRTEKIRSAVSRMTHLMESTLTAARMENGGVSFQVDDCNIASLLWDVCERQGEVSESHVISCDVTSLPESIRADASALEQVFTNLVGNAVKYTPETPEIDVAATIEGDDIVVTVRDNGVGIDTEDLARIGERFFRAKSSMGIAGTGIGLNLVKTLVELHDGSMDIESELGKGSTFTIRLPVAGPAQTAPGTGEGEASLPATNAA